VPGTLSPVVAVSGGVLLAGSTDGVRRVGGLSDDGTDGASTERVLDAGQVLSLRTFDGIPGAFAATERGLYHSLDGVDWTDLGVPEAAVYSVGAASDGSRLYAGTRPAALYEAPIDGGDVVGQWQERESLRAAAERDDWGIDRHDGVAQVRDVRAAPREPDRVVVGVEVGGVYVSDDGGETWEDRRVGGFDAPHTDDVHGLAVVDRDTFLAATGSGLYRTPDAGRTWSRLDAGHRQSYFRDVLVHDGMWYAGGSPTPPSSWDETRDHALFVGADEAERALTAVDAPTHGEVAVGWTVYGGVPLAVTNHGTLLWRRDDWTVAGEVPAPRDIHGRCQPLSAL
jgi:hypothetical protein